VTRLYQISGGDAESRVNSSHRFQPFHGDRVTYFRPYVKAPLFKSLEISPRTRARPDLTLRNVRSAISNGSALFLGDVDERGPWCRRLRDLIADQTSDLGGMMVERLARRRAWP
jgi:hypothetical protein